MQTGSAGLRINSALVSISCTDNSSDKQYDECAVSGKGIQQAIMSRDLSGHFLNDGVVRHLFTIRR